MLIAALTSLSCCFSPDVSLTVIGFLGYTSSIAFFFMLYFAVVVSLNFFFLSSFF